MASALIFDVNDGFNDAANSMATIVSTRELISHQAIMWTLFFNYDMSM